jgi:sugar phosphate isomerase/epimerase
VGQISFEECYKVAGDAGYQGIGLRYNTLRSYLESGHTIEDVKSLAEKNRLEFSECAFLAEWQFYDGVPLICERKREGGRIYSEKQQLAELERFFETCNLLQCKNVTATPSMIRSGDFREAARDYGKLCDRAKGFGINVCVEFMGTAPQINTIKIAWELLQETDRKNAGIVLDTYLFHEGNSSLRDLEKVPVEAIRYVHIADAKNKPRQELNMLKDRLYPGQGAAPIREILDILVSKGYGGYYTLELFNEDYWKQEPSVIARRALESTLALFGENH